MAAYVSVTDLRNAVGVATSLQMFDDTAAGVETAGPLNAAIARACSWCDSYLIRAYGGPFPMTGTTPVMVTEAALYMLMTFGYERKPEFARQLGDGARPDYRKLASTLLTRLAEGAQEIVETTPPKTDLIGGGIIYDEGPRLLVTSANGTSNTGDF